MDAKGKVSTSSKTVHQYFLTIVEEYSRLTAAYPMKSKEEASELLLNFINKLENQSGKVVKRVHADNGTEFIRAFTYLKGQGVEATTSTVHTPESNGLAERMNGVITNMVRS